MLKSHREKVVAVRTAAVVVLCIVRDPTTEGV